MLATFAATPAPNWPKVPKLLVTVELRFGRDKPIAAELIDKLEVAPLEFVDDAGGDERLPDHTAGRKSCANAHTETTKGAFDVVDR